MTTTSRQRARDPQTLTGLLLLPIAVLVCCGFGFLTAMVGAAGVAAALVNPWLVAPMVVIAGALVVVVRRRRARCATPSSLSTPPGSAGGYR